MRISSTSVDKTSRRKTAFEALMSECQNSSMASRLSEKLRRHLRDDFSREERRELVSGCVDGCAPLFLAAKNGSADIVDYLLGQCHADIEQRGLFEVMEEGASHHVTPLWCAAVSGRLAVVKILITHGADVNAVSDSGSTPVRSACYIVRHGLNTAHFEIIRCLVRAGADVTRPNHFGGTCLINAVQSPELVSFLLESCCYAALKPGSAPVQDVVNAEDVQRKTALHYAVQENRIESVKMLLEHGADPTKVSKYGDDVLQTACLKGALMIFNHLLENVQYSPERIANAFELMGSTFQLENHDVSSALFFWRKALEIRLDSVYAKYKKSIVWTTEAPHPVLECVEFESRAELDEMAAANDRSELLKRQALTITERILGPSHKDTIFRYMYAGAAHADANQYAACARLWNYALQLKIRKETLLSCDTSFTARAIVQLYVNILMRQQFSVSGSSPAAMTFQDVYNTTLHVNSGIAEALKLLSYSPAFKSQQDNFDIVLTTWVHLVMVMIRMASSGEDYAKVFTLVEPVLKLRPRTHGGETILHLAVSSSSTLKSRNFMDDDSFALFPSADVADFFLRCGFDVHSRSFRRDTPLHTVCRKENFSRDSALVLLRHGAHLDVFDEDDVTPLDLLRKAARKSSGDSICSAKYLTLKCLSAQALMAMKKPHPELGLLPYTLQEFLYLHKRNKKLS